MADLNLNEVAFLKEKILEDPVGRIVLKAFFAHQAAVNNGRAVSYLTSYQQQEALEHAFFANCYARAFSALEDFCRDQLRSAHP